MNLLNTRSVFALLGLAILALLAVRTAPRMAEVIVPATQGIPQVPVGDNYTYYYSVWGEPRQQNQPPDAAPAYDYRSVAVCPWDTVTDPSQYRPEGRTPAAEAAATEVFRPRAAK